MTCRACRLSRPGRMLAARWLWDPPSVTPSPSRGCVRLGDARCPSGPGGTALGDSSPVPHLPAPFCPSCVGCGGGGMGLCAPHVPHTRGSDGKKGDVGVWGDVLCVVFFFLMEATCGAACAGVGVGLAGWADVWSGWCRWGGKWGRWGHAGGAGCSGAASDILPPAFPPLFSGALSPAGAAASPQGAGASTCSRRSWAGSGDRRGAAGTEQGDPALPLAGNCA